MVTHHFKRLDKTNLFKKDKEFNTYCLIFFVIFKNVILSGKIGLLINKIAYFNDKERQKFYIRYYNNLNEKKIRKEKKLLFPI